MTRPFFLQLSAQDSAETLGRRLVIARSAGLSGVAWRFAVDEASIPLTSEATTWALPADSGCLRPRAISLELPDTTCEALESLVRVWLGRAERVGVELMTLSLVSAGMEAPDRGLPSYQERLNKSYSLLRALRFESETAGVVLSLLVPQDGFLLSPVEARELIEPVNAWNVGLTVDIERAAALGDWSDWLHTLGARVRAVRIGAESQTDLRPKRPIAPSELLGVMEGVVPEDRPVIGDTALSTGQIEVWGGLSRSVEELSSGFGGV